ncbi:protein of unknown function [endosymbiont DhMRE of Dentiscutata heterogama]|uniref:hypothetical protein n=1 Tax=endosymbiont DhMRE of Dentiscutata heterogama TaxID=1609546 RepID=UPI000629D83A|nr:hypothetical protein [endosymbiont DhMRE of Dentiscutata heterogama]CFW93404.1 protein of unknown function [endosymbiont DhMRE of Dentiscutata heterogama]
MPLNTIQALQKLDQLKNKQIKTANDLLTSEQNYKQLNTDYQELKRLQQEILAKVKHLQEDLKKTTIHKEHAEKELAEVKNKLDSANVILNKPKPVMVEAETQTELTLQEKKLDQELQDLRTKLTNLAQMNEDIQKVDQQVYDILGQASSQKGLLLRTQEVIKEIDNIKLQLTQKENQLEQTIKDFQEKEQTQKQQYLQLLTKKDQDWETKLEQALKKPATAEMGTQTDLTGEDIKKMEADITKYQQELTEEQNKVSLLQTKLANLRQEIGTLKNQVTDNPTEQQLLKHVNWKDWKPDEYQTIKNELEAGWEDVSGKQWYWEELRHPYMEIRTKLLELVNSLIEGKESQEQLENRNKDLEEKLKEGDLNEEEKELMEIIEKEEEEVNDYDQILKELGTGNKWDKLRGEYKRVRLLFLEQIARAKEQLKSQQTITELTQKKNELQTQLDLATKTKEELAAELALEKGWVDKWKNDEDKNNTGFFNFLMNKNLSPQSSLFLFSAKKNMLEYAVLYYLSVENLYWEVWMDKNNSAAYPVVDARGDIGRATFVYFILQAREYYKNYTPPPPPNK